MLDLVNLSKYQAYLEGGTFSNALAIRVSQKEAAILNRLDLITHLASEKKIIHAGCFDHSPALIEAKLKKNRWLHKLLVERTKRCVGIDIDREGIAYLKEKFGYHDLIAGDLFNPTTLATLAKEKWDYLILGELLEHIDDPVTFLHQVAITYKGIVSKIIISVPNALVAQNFFNSLKHKEVINSDHRYWFTPYTLAKIATRAGLKVEDFNFCQYFEKTKPGWKYRALHPLRQLVDLRQRSRLKKFPALRECLVALISWVR